MKIIPPIIKSIPNIFCGIRSYSFKNIIPSNTPKTRELWVTGMTLEISPNFKAINKNSSKKPNRLPAIISPHLLILISCTIFLELKPKRPKLIKPIPINSKDAKAVSEKSATANFAKIKAITAKKVPSIVNKISFDQ